MTTKRYSMPFARTIGYQHEHPERTASRTGPGMFANTTFQVWTNRAAMARSIRMQERRAPSPTDWRALIALTPLEGR
jgi:hypothetical protein